MSYFEGLVLVQLVLRYQSRQVSTIHTASDVMAGGNGEKGAGVVIKSHGIVETRGFRSQLAKVEHAFRAVIKPPRRAQAKARIVACQRRQLAAVGRFIQGKQNDG